MKKYNEVVADRYDKEVVGEIGTPGMEKVYAYTLEQLKKCIADVIVIAERRGKKCNELTVLDVGCGDGRLMECWEAYGVMQEHLSGVDLSSKRIERARHNLPKATFSVGDIVDLEVSEKFDLVVAFDVFSHLNTEEEIIKAMASIKERLNPDGLFVWYDICSRDHFNAPANADSWGFSPQQFETYLRKGEFKIIHRKNLFKNFFYRYQSLYQVRRFPRSLVRLAEIVIPGPPGNILFVSEKIN